MLERMYLRWAEKQGHRTRVVDRQQGAPRLPACMHACVRAWCWYMDWCGSAACPPAWLPGGHVPEQCSGAVQQPTAPAVLHGSRPAHPVLLGPASGPTLASAGAPPSPAASAPAPPARRRGGGHQVCGD